MKRLMRRSDWQEGVSNMNIYAVIDTNVIVSSLLSRVTGNTKHFPKKPFVVTPAEMLQIIQEMKSFNRGLLSDRSLRYGKK